MIHMFVPMVALMASAATAQTAPSSADKPAATPAPAARPKAAAPKARVPAATVRQIRRISAATRSATREPLPQGFVNAAQVYPWSDGAIYRLWAAPERVSDIALQPGEQLVSIAAGDTARWTIGDTTSGAGEGRRTHILLKPFAAGLRTNLVISTDRRIYHVELESTPATAMPAMSWTYPEAMVMPARRAPEDVAPAAHRAPAFAVEHLRFDYRISGDHPAWRPLRAFDDGQQVFIEFPSSIATGEVPPLFVMGEGEPQLVNYRQRGRFYIVDRLFDAAELRLGMKRQKIVRITRSGANARIRSEMR